ncbi:MAG: hypothetical protein NT027_01550 [Proteobacteria bacterium]|nr:hypothetical protein [Pseudomonadota bacterium]
MAKAFPQGQNIGSPFVRLNLDTGETLKIDQIGLNNAAGISSLNDGFVRCDLHGSRVLRTDRDLKSWTIKNPWNARLGADGLIYVITYNGEFYSISKTNEVRLEISGLDAPFDFQFTNDGEVWITEQGQGLGRVAKWQRGLNGVFELALTSNRQWLNPEGIVTLGKKIFVLDTESEELVEVYETVETATSISGLGMPILVKENRQELFVYSNSYLGFPSILVLKSK